jgi:hypothetical protein
LALASAVSHSPGVCLPRAGRSESSPPEQSWSPPRDEPRQGAGAWVTRGTDATTRGRTEPPRGVDTCARDRRRRRSVAPESRRSRAPGDETTGCRDRLPAANRSSAGATRGASPTHRAQRVPLHDAVPRARLADGYAVAVTLKAQERVEQPTGLARSGCAPPRALLVGGDLVRHTLGQEQRPNPTIVRLRRTESSSLPSPRQGVGAAARSRRPSPRLRSRTHISLGIGGADRTQGVDHRPPGRSG